MSTRRVQGASRFVLTLTLFSPFTGMAPNAMQPQAAIARTMMADPTGEQIIDKYIEATGGKAAYEKITSRVITGKMSVPAQGISGDVVVHQKAPNLSHTTISIPQLGGKIERGFNGEVGWEKNPMTGSRIFEGEEKQQMLREAALNTELNWRDIYKSAELVGKEDIKGKPAYKVKMTTKSGNEETRFYDVESGLLVQTQMTIKNVQGEFPVVVTPSDWRDVNGVKMPFKSSTELKSLGMEQLITMDKVETNVDVPESTFALPEDIKELAKKTATTGSATQPSK